jgi:hypothetical protein
MLARPNATQVAGMMGAGSAMTAVMCLLLARYWQAALYNPGGFGSEFRALYYPPAVAVVLALLAIGLASLGLEFRTWALICVTPGAGQGMADGVLRGLAVLRPGEVIGVVRGDRRQLVQFPPALGGGRWQGFAPAW